MHRDYSVYTLAQAAEYLGIPIQELLSYDKLISYTMQGFTRMYKVKDLDLLKLTLYEFKNRSKHVKIT
ncbi:MAG: hypothetical protein WC967_13640 [Balneolaceae bacterium]